MRAALLERLGKEELIYPVLFRIGGFEVTSFGVLVAIGALVGLWLYQRELRRSKLAEARISDLAMVLLPIRVVATP